MLRKLAGMLSIVVLVGVLSGIVYASSIQITFGPNSSGTISMSTSSVTFSGVTGYAYQASSTGTFTMGNATVQIENSGHLLPNTESFSVTLGSESLVGLLSLDQMATLGRASLFVGTFTVTSATSGFVSTGFPVGGVSEADFTVYDGYQGAFLSSGEIQPSVPEPGTIAMVGSAILAAAGFLRRKF